MNVLLKFEDVLEDVLLFAQYSVFCALLIVLKSLFMDHHKRL